MFLLMEKNFHSSDPCSCIEVKIFCYFERQTSFQKKTTHTHTHTQKRRAQKDKTIF